MGVLFYCNDSTSTYTNEPQAARCATSKAGYQPRPLEHSKRLAHGRPTGGRR